MVILFIKLNYIFFLRKNNNIEISKSCFERDLKVCYWQLLLRIEKNFGSVQRSVTNFEGRLVVNKFFQKKRNTINSSFRSICEIDIGCRYVTPACSERPIMLLDNCRLYLVTSFVLVNDPKIAFIF